MSDVFKEWGEALEDGYGESVKVEKDGDYPVKLDGAFYLNKNGEVIGINCLIQQDNKEVNTVVYFPMKSGRRMKTLYEDILIPIDWPGLKATEGSALEILKNGIESISSGIKGRQATLIVEGYDSKGQHYFNRTIILKEKNREESSETKEKTEDKNSVPF